MSDVKYFLKVMGKVGYPNPKTSSIARALDYDLENFIADLDRSMGEEKTEEFVKKALEKIQGQNGLKVMVSSTYNEWVSVDLKYVGYDLQDDPNIVRCHFNWIDSQILTIDEDGVQTYNTLNYIIDEADMGDWGEVDDLLDHCRDSISFVVFKNCGFYVSPS